MHQVPVLVYRPHHLRAETGAALEARGDGSTFYALLLKP
jgi:hypothetical protein